MARITVDDVKNAYPHPTTAGDKVWNAIENLESRENYCVGGALCFYLSDHEIGTTALRSFPGRTNLAAALQCANPQIPDTDAEDFAAAIIEANDLEDFGAAWGELELALERV